MMGTKIRNFAPLPREVSLEDLVPKGNFYRYLDRKLDLSFVRDLVEDCYASSGRPSVDPVVFFRLQLVMFFEDIRSERQLMDVGADRLSVRWFLGYDLNEPLPDHSSLTRIRERYGLQRPSGASSSGSLSCAWRPDWCGARNSTSTLPRSRPKPL
jgi:transposase